MSDTALPRLFRGTALPVQIQHFATWPNRGVGRKKYLLAMEYAVLSAEETEMKVHSVGERLDMQEATVE
jgi:hypothetical protein